jgi:hypothetical protein
MKPTYNLEVTVSSDDIRNSQLDNLELVVHRDVFKIVREAIPITFNLENTKRVRNNFLTTDSKVRVSYSKYREFNKNLMSSAYATLKDSI